MTARRIAIVASLIGATVLSSALPVAAQTPPTAKGFDPIRGERSHGWAGQTRSEVLARNGMVATSQALAADAGLDILKAGGNAFDAAIATAAALNVVEPESAGIGGDLFMIAWVAKEGKLVALDASGRAFSGATLDRYRAMKLTSIPGKGIESAVAPGAVDGFDVILKTYGRMGFKEVLAPAIRLAEDGFGVTERIAGEWQAQEMLSEDPDTAAVYLPGGKPPQLYDVFRNPDLAKAFRLIQSGGRDAFYKGPIAQAMIAKSQKLGGTLTMADLAGVKAKWVTPLSTSYLGYDIYQMPASTQGIGVIEEMNILDQCGPKLGIDLQKEGPRSPAYWHLLVEAKKLAYTDLRDHVGDPEYVTVPSERLASKAYAASLCSKIDPKRASAIPPAPEPTGGTVYLATADKEGNVVSLIYSIYGYHGSGVTVPGYGFYLNNRASSFSLKPGHPNAVAPGKRPFYTIIPGFVMKDKKPFLAVGVMSGDQQAQGQMQVMQNILGFGANPQAASDAARFSHNQRSNRLALETDLYAEVGAALKAMGHDVVAASGRGMGGYQAIMIDPKTGLMRGGSDHRKDGQAVGY